jgi:hypothetical protein
MREALQKQKRVFVWLTLLQVLMAMILWLKIGWTDTKTLTDFTMPFLLIFLNELFIVFLIVIKAAQLTGFKAGNTGFVLGLVYFALFQIIIFWETTGDSIVASYLLFPVQFSLIFFPLWLFIYLLIKISKKS